MDEFCSGTSGVSYPGTRPGRVARVSSILPRGTPCRRGHAKVLAWLEDDLTLSARMWSRVAAFMQAKGTYEGAIGNLPDLAQRHRVREVLVASLRQDRAKILSGNEFAAHRTS